MQVATQLNGCPLTKFVHELTTGLGHQTEFLKVNDLRVGIRHERMTEESDWSTSDLDAIEWHASRFDSELPLAVVFNQPFEREPAAIGASVATLCAPSPYAWT